MRNTWKWCAGNCRRHRPLVSCRKATRKKQTTIHRNPTRKRGATGIAPRLRVLKLRYLAILFGRRPLFTVAWGAAPGMCNDMNSLDEDPLGQEDRLS